MDDVNFKDIRVLSTALDLKNNTKKNIVEIFNQLQTGSILKGLVVGSTPKGEAILHTAYGRVAIPNNQGFVQGDKLAIQISGNANQFQGNIVSVNDELLQTSKPINLAATQLPNNRVNSKIQDATNVTVDSSKNVPQIITGKITYLNLSNISKQSVLYKELVKTITENPSINITLQIKPSSDKTNSAFNITGDIVNDDRSQRQLLKTDFGIISTENIQLPTGKKLSLEIINLNNKPLNFDLARSVSSFVFNTNKLWSNTEIGNTDYQKQPLLPSRISEIAVPNKEMLEHNISLQPKNTIASTELKVIQQNLDGKSISFNELTNMTPNVNNLDTKKLATNEPNPQALYALKEIRKPGQKAETDKKINLRSSNNVSNFNKSNDELTKEEVIGQNNNNANRIIKNLGESIDQIKNLANEYSKIKELLIPNIGVNDDNQKWQTIFIPFYNGQSVEEKEVRITKSRDHYLRFVLNVNLEEPGPIQLDGLVKFKENSKVPVNFDMILRSTKKLSVGFQREIASIFSTSKEITGIAGQMQFEESTDLSYPN